jgi:hypothetical protein
MYFVGHKQFTELSDAIDFCKSGSYNLTVTDENGIVLMKHEPIDLEDIYGILLAKSILRKPNDYKQNNKISKKLVSQIS